MKTAQESDATHAQWFELWSLREDVNLGLEPGGALRLSSRWGDIVIREPSEVVREALRRMRLGPVSLENVLASGGGELPGARAQLGQVLGNLQPLIVRSLATGSGQLLLSVVPLTVRSRFEPVPLAQDVPVRLSAYASLRTDGTEYRIESPLALHRILLHGAEAMRMIAPLAGPSTPAALEALSARPAAVRGVLAYLAAAGALTVAEPRETAAFAEDSEPALEGWSASDLDFHVRSTLGRHDGNFGITYPTGSGVPPEPVVKPQAARTIPLYRPSWDELREKDPTLTVAMESRHSQRRYGADPVTLRELGELLYRTARVRSLITPPPGWHGIADGGDEAAEFSDRPYPSGGASFEMELYVTVGACEGLPSGVYHYDPLGHCLEPIDTGNGAPNELLACARVSGAMDEPPPLLISLTARFRRVSWKYEGLAYRLVLVHVGILTQSLYLVCAAMRLAPCALGGVSIEAAARAFGTDWRTEPCVGQFMVGREPDSDSRDVGGQWRDANDAGWVGRALASNGR
jgi:SagB-type dehydrogenase family enzyme